VTAEIKQKLNQVFREVFELPDLEITETMTAQDLKQWDSLTHIDLIYSAEKAFGVSFTTKEVKSLHNVGDFIALINSRTR
jgi:acyl carrier protein